MVPYVHARRLRQQPIAYLRLQIGVGLAMLVVLAATNLDLPKIQRPAEIIYVTEPSTVSSIAATSALSLASDFNAVLVLPPAYPQPAGPELPIPPARTRASVGVVSGPGVNYSVLGLLPAGAALQISGRDASGVWLAVAFPPGSSAIAWLPAAQVSGLEQQPATRVLGVTPAR